jgi:hypothetical protein
VEGLDEGEAAAIALAVLLDADLLLMDDGEGVIVARGKGLRVMAHLEFSILPPSAAWLTLLRRSASFGERLLESRTRFLIRW